MKKKIITAIFVTIILIVYFSFPILFGMTTDVYNSVCEDLHRISNNKDVYKLKYTVSTGASWAIIDSTDESLVNKYVIVENMVDPRFLKINDCFELDVNGFLFVVSDEKKKIEFSGEDIWCISASDIYLYVPDKELYKDTYTFFDLNWIGLGKFIVGLILPQFRYSY